MARKSKLQSNGKSERQSKLQLGRPTDVPASPDAAVLDRVPNPHPDT